MGEPEYDLQGLPESQNGPRGTLRFDSMVAGACFCAYRLVVELQRNAESQLLAARVIVPRFRCHGAG